MLFFPLVFCIFMFVLLCNLVGLIPHAFAVTSHIIITASLALIVFFTVVVVGLKEHGLHFFKLFVPSGVPIYILPLVVAIEVVLVFRAPGQPFGASVRQHAGRPYHAQRVRRFVVMLLGAGAVIKALARAAFRDDHRA